MVPKYRYVILTLVFFATTINYLDRQVISLLKPILEKEFSWTEKDYSWIVIAFQASYALGLLGFGRLIDKIGTKKGYAFSLTLWSTAAVAHIFARGTVSFAVVRSFLGISEAGNFPAAVKTVAEWFPKKDRALATGIFNSGTNLGAIIAPIVVPLIAVCWGWRMAFAITGGIGFFWLIFWFLLYELPSKSKRVSKAELDYINSDEVAGEKVDAKPIKWSKLITYKQTWSIISARFFSDPVWYFLLFWLPSFLKEEYGMNGTAVSLPIGLVYTFACVGSIGGGWLSSFLIRCNWSVSRARSVSLLIFALCVTPIIFAQFLGQYSAWFAIIIIGIAAAAHQAWSANVYTLASDMFPKKVVGSVVGLASTFGTVSGILMSFFTGYLLDAYKQSGDIRIAYYIIFFVCGVAYLLAWSLIKAFAPKMKPIQA
jgi:ACS family hexuronate transporter-like MFS transporter